MQTADRQCAFAFRRLFFDEAGEYTRMQKVRGLITMNETLDEFTGQQVSEQYDLDGALISSNPVTTQARRITVEA
jgi:hypothetical protein